MITLPNLRFSSTESALANKLAHAEGIVSQDELVDELLKLRGGIYPGRPLKVHLHYLRKRLAPYGIKIVCRHRLGYVMQEMPEPQRHLAQVA